MDKIDNLDLKLLYEIEQNARESISKIAKKVRSSQQVVSYRIQSLEKRGIITQYYTIIDLAKIGYTSYRTMMRLSRVNEQKRNEIIAYLSKHPNILWLVECGGRWDLIVDITAKNIAQYFLLLREIKNKFPENIQNYETLPIVQAVYFGRDYLIKRKREIKHLPSFGHELEKEIDNLDLKILHFLSENARANAVDIAGKVKVSPNTVILRMKDLKKRGIIQGFKPLIHLEKIGYQGYKALIKFQNIEEEKEKETVNYLKEYVEVAGVIKLVGSWDFEIEFEVKTQEEMLNLIRSFRDKFNEVIREFEVIPLFHEYKYNFFPYDLLAKSKYIYAKK